MEEKKIKNIKDIINGQEFSIADLMKIFKSVIILQKKYLLVLLCFFVFGSIFHFWIQKVEFQSEATVLIEQNTPTNAGAIAGLLGISGNNFGQISDNIFGPEMYEDIVKSDAFLNELANTKFLYDETSAKSKTLSQYFNEYDKKNYLEKTNFGSKIISTKSNKHKIYFNTSNGNSDTSFWYKSLYFSNKVPPIVEVPNDILKASEDLKERIKLEIKGKKIIVKVTMPEEELSANLCKLVLEKIINYVSVYKTNRQRDNIFYLEKNYNEAKLKYTTAQLALANYKDKNFGIIFQSSQTREQILYNELNLAFNLYNQFSIQLEQAKFDYKKEQPLFIVTDPIKLLGNSNKSFLILLLKYLLVYSLFAFAYVFYKIINS